LAGEFLNQQVGLCVLLTIFGGAGLIANDLRTGAILVYLSRPLTRRDYVLGKLSVLLALNLCVTLVPGLLLYLVGLGLAPELYAKLELLWIAPAIVLHSLTISLSIGLLSLAVSALSRNPRVAGLGFFGVVAGLEMVRGVLILISRSPWAALVSLQADIRALGAAMFGLALRRAENVPVTAAAAVLVVVAAACLVLLRARVRAVEIVR
jgi:ABC-type transport system involved in multi-copper enzyme maturation permease subunit